MWCTVLAVSAVLFAAGEAAKLPPYIVPCSLSSHNEEFSKCIMRSGNEAIPKLANGEKKFRVPSMKPLEVPSMTLSQGTAQAGLNVTWNPAFFWGLEGAKLVNVTCDIKKRHCEFKLNVPNFSLTGTHRSNGRVLLLPIRGSGPSSLNVTNLLVQYDFDWPSGKGQDGKMHISLVNTEIKIVSIDFMKMYFDGLFGGDKLLEDNINVFLNENWRELVKEFGPGLAEACGEVIRLFITNIAKAVPESEFFAS